MATARNETKRGVLNETTMTVHRRKPGAADIHTVCGHTYHVERGRLRLVDVAQITEATNTSRCGTCFEEGGGY
jgi:hypothetical protein